MTADLRAPKERTPQAHEGSARGVRAHQMIEDPQAVAGGRQPPRAQNEARRDQHDDDRALQGCHVN